MRLLSQTSTLFPYTTLFRSEGEQDPGERGVRLGQVVVQRKRLEGIRPGPRRTPDRKSTRLNSSHRTISYAVFCLKKKKLIKECQRMHDSHGFVFDVYPRTLP